MITREDADNLRDQLLALLAEDAHNTQRLLARLEAITRESGIGAHAALLLILTQLAFEEAEARRHWEAILAHGHQLARNLGREPGIRVAVLDYFMNINRRLVQPTLIELQMRESGFPEQDVDRTTGLATDRRFRSVLQNELRRARRYEQKTSLVLVDVDHFAAINERFDPLVGDRLLRELAILLNNNIRDIDLAARPGEDEMAMLLPETGRNGALLVAERFRREVEAYFSGRESGERIVGMTISAGVACYPDDATTPETLLERAAQALYQAKASGRNAIQLYQPERRRYLRFELEPGRFEVEVLTPVDHSAHLKNLSRNGILFTSPESLDVGERIEIRLAEVEDEPGKAWRIRGTVVRLEQLPTDGTTVSEVSDEDDVDDEPDRYEIGVALDLDWAAGSDDLLDFLEHAQSHSLGESR